MARVVHVTSTHKQTDSRIYQRECVSLSEAGFDITVVAHGSMSGTQRGVRFEPMPERFTRLNVIMHPSGLAGWLRSLNADIIHLHDPDLLPLAGVLQAQGQCVVYDCHEWYRKVFPHKGWIPVFAWAAGTGLSALERAILPRIGAIVAPTDELAAIYAPYNRQVVTVRNFAPISGTPEPSRPGVKSIDVIHVGTLSSARLEFMLDVIRELNNKRVSTLCLLGVSAALRRRIAGDRSLDGVVQAVDHVPSAEVVRYLTDARVGLNYHPFQPRFMVAIPMKVFEYMRYALPFVSTALPPLTTLLEGSGAGYLLRENTVEAFVGALHSLLDDEAESQRMGERGCELVMSQYNWESEAPRLIRLYETLLERSSGQGKTREGARACAG